MTRVLFWNIQQFGLNKFYNPSQKRQRGNGGLPLNQAASQRLRLFGNVVFATRPDIIVVIEVSSGAPALFDLISFTGGFNGLVWLQQTLNGMVFAGGGGGPVFPGGWNQVPPLRMGTGGRSEAVGILYRRQDNAGTTIRYFTGPNIWTGGHNGLSVPAGGGIAPAAYPGAGPGGPDVAGMLAPGLLPRRQIPNVANVQYNANLWEDQVASRFQFGSNLVGPPPNLVHFLGYREPCMATFTEVTPPGGGPAVVQRNLTLFGVHAPPAAAAIYMGLLGQVADISGALGPHETRVVGGDFNLNLLQVGGTASAAYNPLINAGGVGNYTPLIAPTAAGIPVNLDQYQGYFATHVRSSKNTRVSTFLWSDVPAGNLSAYPGYGYIGSNFAANFYAIDNIFVHPVQAGPGYNYRTTIMNLVTGTPFAAAPADNPPQGTIALATGFQSPPPLPAGWPQIPTAADYPGAGRAKRMTGWDNFGRIRSTSDHFAVFADV